VGYRLTEPAQHDLAEAEQYSIDEWDILQAIEYIEQLQASFLLLDEFPFKGRIDETYEDQEVRKFPLKYHIILYRIVEDDIEILAIPHGSKHPDNYRS